MQVNEGTIDRILRLTVAAIIIVLFFIGIIDGYWSLLLVLSGMFLMSGTTGYCPLYTPLGINTCKK